MVILLWSIRVLLAELVGLFSNWLQLGAIPILKWYASTNWYWYYTIDPWGYQLWNGFMIIDMLLFWYLARKLGLIDWIKNINDGE